jgi:hypothetical protein
MPPPYDFGSPYSLYPSPLVNRYATKQRSQTVTFTQEQENMARMTLRRIHTNATDVEIASGSALNVLLAAIGRYPARKMEGMLLPADVLRQVNVASKPGHSLGVLRAGGKIDWPLALEEMLTPRQRQEISLRADALVRGASSGRLDAAVGKDLHKEVHALRARLLQKVNDLPAYQYLDAKRFLNDLEGAVRAVQEGETTAQNGFDQFVGGQARTVQDLVGYMVARGLVFASATPRGESSYRALCNALADYDRALNAQGNAAQDMVSKE